MTDQFYITLPSNSSMELYPANKTSSYKVHLSNAIELDPSRWEVALSEIQFLHSWYNVRENKNVMVKTTYHPSLKEGKSISFRIIIPSGYYSNTEEIVKRLNKSEDLLRPLKYSYNKLNKKVQVDVPENVKLSLNNSDIARCLGFNPSRELSAGKSLSEGLSRNELYNAIYVYTDIIENQNTGDYKVPLLRIVPVTSKHGDLCCVKYDKPHYIPINRSHIQTIEINLRDDTGELISFEAGKAIVTLVFRRKVSKFYD